MKDNGPLKCVLEFAKSLPDVVCGVTWYGFGSYFRNDCLFSDIDVLAVCPTVEDAVEIRRLASRTLVDWPIHLLIMIESEEKETRFVATQDCVLIYQSSD